ncbi:hypothetical protein E2C01_081024 [Portunus trituberculatus]|uniref:Uncharacterized protein n=1 Tax=Portunus trituberculatus TaxID=210409 RepID=A0A5B7IWW8_PORTR|nr:hypothetical protein [Portunus trituberculatus]
MGEPSLLFRRRFIQRHRRLATPSHLSLATGKSRVQLSPSSTCTSHYIRFSRRHIRTVRVYRGAYYNVTVDGDSLDIWTHVKRKGSHVLEV